MKNRCFFKSVFLNEGFSFELSAITRLYYNRVALRESWIEREITGIERGGIGRELIVGLQPIPRDSNDNKSGGHVE